MEATLMTYEGPAIVEGEAIAELRLRVFADYDEGAPFPDGPLGSLRGWEAEIRYPVLPRAVSAWIDAPDGVTVRLPNAPQVGRAFVTVDKAYGDEWTVHLTGAGAPPVPEN
ncbi:MAG TPA: hypothetical protein VIU15_39600 [Streptomyces sp.]